MMLARCVEVLTLVFQSGGHVHLEQPLNAMSWLERVVRQFIHLIGASCINIAACAYGMDIYKAWMFASSFSGLRPLGCTCQHPPNSHVRLQGLRDESGAFASRATAQYPFQLAQQLLICNIGGTPFGHPSTRFTMVVTECDHAHQTTPGLSFCTNRWGWSFFPP